MEKNYKPIEIDGINVPILLEDGLEYEFAKNALEKCDIKEFKDGDFIIFNKENMYVLHKTKIVPDDSDLNVLYLSAFRTNFVSDIDFDAAAENMVSPQEMT